MKTVFVGLSGGVDSSVTALLLKQQGYDVVGVYMKNWSQSLPGFACPWREDYQDAKRVAVQLGLRFEMFDFEKEYQEKVVNYMIDEYKIGRTPNPDIMCNQEIKFKLFTSTALGQGASCIATGHYARSQGGNLYTAKDVFKDQTYFLYRVTSAALKKTIFPLGDYVKTQVRELASQANLVTATKKESMGICFVGKVGIKEFLSQYVSTQPGPIIDQFGLQVGQHDGAIFYTIGQRHGLNVGGGLPYYVVNKDIATNTVFVSTKIDDKRLWTKQFSLTSSHWIGATPNPNKPYLVRLRHRGPLLGAKFSGNNLSTIMLDDPAKALNAGQSAVVYHGNLVLGGGVIAPLR
jgi:tRNA-uridine 2-sulfurtransferase